MKKWKLKRLDQCLNCPFRKDSDPFDIPNGYSVQRHHKLKQTDLGNIPVGEQLKDEAEGKPFKIMSCHHDHEAHCIGWLDNQRNTNNIRLRIQLIDCENIDRINLSGEQHKTLEDTIPNHE